MDVLIVFVLATLAGTGAYLATLRWDRSGAALPGEGFLPEEEQMQTEALQTSAATAPPRVIGGEQPYVPLAPGRRSIQTRLLGVLGIAVLIPVAAIAFALATYGVGRIIVEAITRFFESNVN